MFLLKNLQKNHIFIQNTNLHFFSPNSAVIVTHPSWLIWSKQLKKELQETTKSRIWTDKFHEIPWIPIFWWHLHGSPLLSIWERIFQVRYFKKEVGNTLHSVNSPTTWIKFYSILIPIYSDWTKMDIYLQSTLYPWTFYWPTTPLVIECLSILTFSRIIY